MTIPSTYTLWKYNDKPNRMTYSVTVRFGWTPDMLQKTRLQYVAACQAAREGKRVIVASNDPVFTRNTYPQNIHDEARVQIFGDVAVQVAPGITRQVTINCFDETTTGQQLLDELWALVDVMNTIEAVEVVEQALPPTPATLRPSRQRIDIPEQVADEMIYDPSDDEGSYDMRKA